jgi:hypothetical protein
MRIGRVVLVTVLLVVGVAATILAVRALGGTEEAEAVLPARLERSLVSEQVGRSVEVDLASTRKVVLDGERPVFLVPGDDGDACIGLEGGGAACGPADMVTRGRLLLIIVDGGGDVPALPIRANGATTAAVYGYQPDRRAELASIVAADGQVLGSGHIVDGLWRVEIRTNSQSRRMTHVRFEAAGSAPPPPPVDLDRPAEQR